MRSQSRFGSKMMIGSTTSMGKVREDTMSQASSYMDVQEMSASQLGSAMRGLSRLFNSQGGIESNNQDAITQFVAKKLKI